MGGSARSVVQNGKRNLFKRVAGALVLPSLLGYKTERNQIVNTQLVLRACVIKGIIKDS